MRADALALIVLLCAFPALAQDVPRDVLVPRLLEQDSARDIDFEIDVGAPTRGERGMVVPVELSIPLDQLRFVDDGRELVAKVSMLIVAGGRVTRVIESSRRIAAPRDTVPEGTATKRFELALERGRRAVSIVVFDENARLAGAQSVIVEETGVSLEMVADGPAADAAWEEALARAAQEKKPLVVFFRSRGCARCREVERTAVPHPTIQRRMPAVVFAVLPADAGEAAKAWASDGAGVALFDRSGSLRVRWPFIPGTMSLGTIIDSAIAVHPHFERAVQLSESGAPDAAEVELAIGLARLGRTTDARAALTRVPADAKPETQQAAAVAGAMLDANEGKAADALAKLREITASPATPKIAADAALGIGAIERRAGQRPSGAIRILPLAQQIVVGRHTVKTHVTSAAVAAVSISLDGREIKRVDRPPFSATLDFGDVPERATIAVIAFDQKGQTIGRDERVVNEGGETFSLRLTAPREGPASGRVRVSMTLRVPPARRVERVTVFWNDADRAVLKGAPWEAIVEIPDGQVGVLRALAELSDGRTSEDAVLLNAGGVAGRADVQLVELPITIMKRDGSFPEVTAERITVREGGNVRRVESLATAAETPLTVGLLIDVSESMQKTLPDVQEAAIRFLETILGERDRAFIVAFESRARLVQPATSDVSALRRQIMNVRPDGLTALHDAMVLGLLQFEGIKGRRAMIVFSDGVDITSQYSATQVGELARRVNVPIHVIASLPGIPAAAGANAQAAADGELRPVAQSTGGTSHTLHDLAELPAAYARIQRALRAQLLAFVRTDPGTRENEWRNVRIEVEGTDLVVYAPAGFYASW